MNAVSLLQEGTNAPATSDRALKHNLGPGAAYVFSSLLVVGCFVADWVLPRGATAAIGYCAVPAIAVGTRSRRFMYWITIACSILDWVAVLGEPPGNPLWESLFDRVMVMATVWFVLFLVLRRVAVIRQLVQQRQALKNASMELERSNGELSRFASVVAHDLKGSLNTVGLFTQSWSSSFPDDRHVEYLHSIESELTQMDQFIQRLLIYGRVGAQHLKTQECDCTQILNDVRQHLTADIKLSGATVSSDPLPVIQADPMLIAELFQNLIENAIKYRRDEALLIRISANQQPEGWLFSVRDNGIGINPEDSQRIFEPFHQIGDNKSAQKGVGLGLATCKQIVERHGGQISVQSEPGQGTTFIFTLGTHAEMRAS